MNPGSGSPNKKLLDLIKSGGSGLLHPEVKFFSRKSNKAPAERDLSEQGLGLHALDMLSSMRRTLDNIWSNIFLRIRREDKHLLFTGCSRGDGVSFISFHLSMYLAMVHKLKVLYVDTDIDRGASESPLYYPMGHTGLASYFMEGAKLSEIILNTNIEGFKILPAGAGKTTVSSSTIIKHTELMDCLFSYDQDNFDLVVYDSKPVTHSPLGLFLSKNMNQIFMVCRYATTRREVCMQAIDLFRENGMGVSGMLLNDRQFPVPDVVYNLIK
jgi:Mrp family chromosome partitioning ATPase